MARNEEKAHSVLNRYLAGKGELEAPVKRPYLASECHDLNDADKWRAQILREIGKKVMEIQNAGLGEHKIRDLNDEINKLIREKGHWERQIVELGGPDYAKAAPPITDSAGNLIEGATGRGAGYRYFGAAKNLPGVKELFAKEAAKIPRRSRYQLHKRINPDYYGLRDEDDGVLVRVESDATAAKRAKLRAEWEAKSKEQREAMATVTGGKVTVEDRAGGEASQFVAYVPLPDSQAIEQTIIAERKAKLLEKYSTPGLQAQQAEAKRLLNKRL